MSREYRYRPKKGRFKKRFTTIILIAGLLAGGHAICKNLINTGAVNTNNVEYPMLTPAITEQVTVTPEPTPVVTPVPTEVPTPEVTPVTHVDNGVNKGDSVTSIKSVNLRLGPTTESFRLGELPRNTTVDRIMSIDGFDLIRYDGRLAFVSTDFTSVCDVDYNNDYY